MTQRASTLVLLLAFFGVTSCGGSAGNQTELLAVEDTCVGPQFPQLVQGDHCLWVGNSPDIERAYVRFDLSSVPAGAVVSEAKVELYYDLCDAGGPIAIAAYPAGGPWDAATMLWDDVPVENPTDPPLDVLTLGGTAAQPGGPNWCGDVGTYVAQEGTHASKAGWYVTDLVRGWLAGQPNDGVMFLVGAGAGQFVARFGHEGDTDDPDCDNRPARLLVKHD